MTHLACMVLALAVGAATTRAQQAAERDPLQEKIELKLATEAEAKALPTTRASSPADLVRFSIEDNHLHLRTTAAPTDNERVHVEVPNLAGIVFMQIRGERADPKQPYLPEFFMLIQNDYTLPGAAMAITHVSINPSQIVIARDADLGQDMLNVQLLQSGQYLAEGEDMVHFRVDRLRDDEEKPLIKLHLTAPNIVELVRRYPSETSQYLEPIFNDFGQADVLFRVNPQTAWQVLGPTYTPPADVSAKAAALLKQLDAEDPQQREAAAAELKALGQPAALVLMRRDRSGLTEEQNMQLDTFLAPYKPLPEEEAAKMRGDPKFLLLCLGAEDAALRKLALEQLRKVTKQPIEFDVNADPRARSETVAKLRAKLITPAATTYPALSSTRPAKAS